MTEKEAELLGKVCVRRDELARELHTERRLRESQYDCHGGPGTTQEACGACLTCVTRKLEDALTRLENERQRNIAFCNKFADLREQLGASDAKLATAHAEHAITKQLMESVAASWRADVTRRKLTMERMTAELAAVRVCFAEASHNAGPAFVAHEELKKLEGVVIQNDDEHEALLFRIREIMNAPEFDPAAGRTVELATLARIVEHYEKKRWPLA